MNGGQLAFETGGPSDPTLSCLHLQFEFCNLLAGPLELLFDAGPLRPKWALQLLKSPAQFTNDCFTRPNHRFQLTEPLVSFSQLVEQFRPTGAFVCRAVHRRQFTQRRGTAE